MLLEYLFGCSLQRHAAAFHHDDSIGLERVIHEMRDVHDGDTAPRERVDDALDCAVAFGVEHGAGFVEYQDARLHGERAGDGDALLLAAG